MLLILKDEAGFYTGAKTVYMAGWRGAYQLVRSARAGRGRGAGVPGPTRCLIRAFPTRKGRHRQRARADRLASRPCAARGRGRRHGQRPPRVSPSLGAGQDAAMC